MRHLYNVYDPANPKAEPHIFRSRGLGETLDEAKAFQAVQMAGKVIGPPQPTPLCSIERMYAHGMVGVYAPDSPV